MAEETVNKGMNALLVVEDFNLKTVLTSWNKSSLTNTLTNDKL